MVSGKPTARITDSTACPVPGHGTNPLVQGSPNVFYDELPAARLGDESACGSPITQAVAYSVIINGKPAATLGSVGAHGNTVSSGSRTVIIGDVAIGSAPPIKTLTTDDEGMGPGGNHEAETNASRVDALGKEPSRATSAQALPQSLNNGDDSSREQVLGDEQEPPVVNMAEDRRESIVNDTPALFEVADNPHASGQEPWYAFDVFEEVNENEQAFEAVGREVGIEPRLLKAIAHIETTHGYYDRIHPRNTSFRPMNIN
ncbi:PAAR domain-containing protein [Vreelandella gomseomensis]|uniref:PAAR domain-containing protein n=1 Tax=Vreelandella gomseomensis TaxID=370766 RepID=A0ABU1GFV0_9GAMM|nr:PAAR domain-containing protein [Halomonas gomseomensis]MDR5875865.1 PAAR domain-containing protein [Halomonas gomseomensis]